ncbi:phosphotransferase enzyme family protein [Chitinasiproducens palmae]|uniref:Ser/Thr protein kinase RdoA involved in Cpx stress response, MazF antagonist n=1 Tax=Chitinasiproducens palmae TaxID=1770053 RepID=A0A1H2PKR6_9BURK|nr:phosphotransferase [Chitinasiproducens palmae]SDV47055.1 Ser/Thr protein kinase RdoA involved in Cpx stress response, MazF antagonist [Chitinasiproducens palmae]
MVLSGDAFESTCRAYGLVVHGAPRRVSERVWLIASDQGDVAMKGYASEHLTRASKEAALLSHLRNHPDPRFRVQTLLRTATGAPLFAGRGFHAMLTRWERGEFKTYDRFDPEAWRALGASLAALHLSLDRFNAPSMDTLRMRLGAIDVNQVRGALQQAAQRAGSRDDAAHLRRYVELSLRMIEQHYRGSIEAFPLDDPQRAIHNDYNQFNYLFPGTLPPIILDWEAAIGAPREYELVRCLNHLPLEAPRLAAAFVQAYRAVRAVRRENIAWAVDAACLQHAIKLWVVRGWFDDPNRFASHLAGAVAMASVMVDARARLIDFFYRCMDGCA